MTGDNTRNSFRRDRHFSATRMQQGRVFLDADWNEQVDIDGWLRHTTTGDLLGKCGFPQDAAGFGLVPIGTDLLIAPGRGYVAGKLVENPGPVPVVLERVSGTGVGTTWKVATGIRLRVGQPLVLDGAALTDAVFVSEISVDDDGFQTVRMSETLGPGDRKDGVAGAAVGAQPHLLDDTRPTAAGDYLAYLEVWERSISALDDPLLREVALGGPDTATRDQRIWQVRLLPVAELGIPLPPSCKSLGEGWRPEGDVDAATLAARADPGSAADDPCALPASGGYRSVENHLYRVEVHHGGTVGSDTVRWKWSRDNGIHRARLLGVADGALVVDEVGHDDATAFRSGDWLEVIDERRVLARRSGFFVKLGEVNGERLGVAQILDAGTLDPVVDNGEPDVAVLPAQGQVRRWEGGVPVEADVTTWAPLENGVEVRFGDGFARAGDYWTIPARTVTADVEWPSDAASGTPAPVAPEGIRRDYCPLALVAFDGTNWSVTSDCRPLIPPLNDLETFHYLGGDGQEVTAEPGSQRVPADSPLRVGVARGGTPVAGRPVRFTVGESGSRAALSALPGADVLSDNGAELVVRTDQDGVAAAAVALHPGRRFHHVTAELLDTDVLTQAARTHLPIRFGAEVEPATASGRDPGIHVTNIRLRNPPDGADTLVANSTVPWPALADGLTLELDETPAPEALKRGIVGKVTFDQPHPLSGTEQKQLSAVVHGPEWLRQETEIVGVFVPDHRNVVWQPIEQAARWLREVATTVFERFEPPTRPARLIVHGDRIWAERDPRLLLDGNLFAEPGAAAGVTYPSGDGVRGGDLVLPFRLGAARPRLIIVPVPGGPVLQTLPGADWPARLSEGLRFGIERELIAPAAEDLGFEVSTTQFDRGRATDAVHRTAIDGRPLAILIEARLRPVVEGLLRSLTTVGLRMEVKTTQAQDVVRTLRAAVQSGRTDLILATSDQAHALRDSVGDLLGDEVVL